MVAEHEDAIKALHDEMAELDVAERVISRLTHVMHAEQGNFVLTSPGATGTVRKPPNIPTIPEMITLILKPNALLAVGPSMTPKQIADEIRVRWWPNVTPTEISPIAWRMAKRGELIKDGTMYQWPTPDANGVMKVTPPDGDEPPEDEAEQN